jgi:acetoin utilization deacetylase AcuC-like enzyme
MTHEIFYSPQYCAASYAFDTTRKSAWIADSLARTPVDGVTVVEPLPLSADTVAETHSPEYVDAIATGEPWSLASSQGLRWCKGILPSVLSSNGGVVAAVKSALANGIAGSLSSGMHHARREAGLGFCTFNGLVIAAKESGCQDVLILDLDAHGGGGTQSLISGDVRIRQLDLVVDAFDTHDDSILVKNRDDYLPALVRSLGSIDRNPELVIYNAGMDVFEDDCGFLSVEEIAARESFVFQWCHERGIPVAYAMAGGYTGKTTRERLVALHRCTIRAAAYYSKLWRVAA